ncbi:hypothetical protein FNF27_00912 [Cafeteria roenbergensis]|uniref:WW domain-containing protein n=1 Tax=Cafeteria roenbergensis TaxID=33653 RepID=A0A5A8EP56_CAFRO|nr:hypothetical protein FNF29_01159 [Cafeteria roenbergensis]KAA0177740.1 hypothetical protein FNF27_00912 [Cafeteria roenbergensis]|eukprot:KAA0156366.1 hypothetical protein FNF29_01159 [Cafeteria roenbergensis]
MPAAATDPAVVKLVLDRTYRRLRSDIEQAHGPSPEIMGTIRRSMQALHREAEADLKARERHARWLAGEPGKMCSCCAAHAASGAGGSPEAADEDCTLEPGMLTVEQAWERALDASGAEYFWHTRTRERRWQRPDLRLHIAAEKRRLAHERSVEARRAERAAAEREASAEAAAAESVKAAAKPRVRQWALDAGWQYGKHKPVKGVAPQLALARLLASVHTLPHCVLKALTVDPSSRSSILKAYKRALLTMHVDKLVGRSVAERTVCEAALAEISAAKAAMP